MGWFFFSYCCDVLSRVKEMQMAVQNKTEKEKKKKIENRHLTREVQYVS